MDFRPPGGPIGLAVRRARGPIIASCITYLTFVALGIALATAGWPFAANERDSIVTVHRQAQSLRHTDMKDAGWIYVAAMPFFLLGSLWEFLAQASPPRSATLTRRRARVS